MVASVDERVDAILAVLSLQNFQRFRDDNLIRKFLMGPKMRFLASGEIPYRREILNGDSNGILMMSDVIFCRPSYL